jgi:hypothetical protein
MDTKGKLNGEEKVGRCCTVATAVGSSHTSRRNWTWTAEPLKTLAAAVLRICDRNESRRRFRMTPRHCLAH